MVSATRASRFVEKGVQGDVNLQIRAGVSFYPVNFFVN